MLRRLTPLLTRRDLPALLAGLAALLALPALWTGWQFDDYVQRDLLRAHPGLAGLGPATLELFTFLDGDPARARALMERGELAWWTLPAARTAFWRPLAGLTHWLDYQLWPRSSALMHLHSLAWFAALAAAAALLYRRLLGPSAAAGLAALLYALDDARGFGAAWLANRNALCAALFGVLAILAHVRWREGGGARAGWLAALWLVLGLLSAEAAVGALAYLAAYALWLDRGAPAARLLSLLPAVALVALWRAAHRALGYGAWGTTYLDPAAEPLRFAAAALVRAPLLLLGQWTPLPAELSPYLEPAALGALWLGGALVLGGLAWAFWPLLRADAAARFWATGMLLAALPPSAALPANRLLFFVGLGAMGLLARFLLADAGAGARRLAARSLLVVHLGLGPLLLPLTAYSPALLGGAEAALATLPSDAGVRRREIVVVAAPSAFSLSAIGSVRAEAGVPAPARSLLLAASLGRVHVTRPDASTLVVRPEGGYLLGFEGVFRAPWHPFAPGEQVRLGDVTARVAAFTADGRPAAAEFRFDTPLEDPARQWFVWQGGVYLPFTLPPVGGERWVEVL
jgi:hypothetical protein